MKRYLFLITAAVIFFSACNDPIFYAISLEEKILEPKIEGTPINFVEFNGKMYTASGSDIHVYEGGAKWGDSPKVGGNVNSLAVVNNRIYALCIESGERKIKCLSADGARWDEIPGSSGQNIQKIYSAGDRLFVGVGNTDSYYIMNFNGYAFSPARINTGRNMINGAAFDGTYYYISAKDMISESGGGIYVTNDPDAGNSYTLAGNNIPFMGIINTPFNKVFAISRDGNLYTVNGFSVDQTGSSFGEGHKATGALAVWTNDAADYLLLAGRQNTQNQTTSSGYKYGYLELNIGGGIISGGFHEPGDGSPTTLMPGDSNETYNSTIGKRPVYHLYQASDGTLFASTQKDGVWSYRNRRGKWHWNAEE